MSGKVSDNVGRSSGLVKAAPGGISTVAGDKSSPTVGDVWYNSSTGKLRAYVTANAWSAGGALGSVRRSAQGFGLKGAAAVAGGKDASSVLGTSEEYDGSSWTAGGATNTDSEGAAQAGLQAARIKSGGYDGSNPTAGSETYDGSSWTAITAAPTAKYEGGGLGTSTAFVLFAGGPGVSNSTHTWNGTSWATGGTMNTPLHYANGCGTITAGLSVGGLNPTPTNVNVVEEYNGTDWTTVTAYPTTISHRAVAGAQTNALVIAGKTDNSTSTVTDECYSYDGTNWTQTTDFPYKTYLGGASKSDATAGGSTIHIGGYDHDASGAVVARTHHWLGTDSVSVSTE